MTAAGGVDPDTLGKATWTFLHTLAASYPPKPSSEEQRRVTRFMSDFSQLYPCAPCAQSFRQIMREHPAEVTSGPLFATWMCSVHNKVNEELGKPLFDCGGIGDRWGVCEQCEAHKIDLLQFKAMFKARL